MRDNVETEKTSHEIDTQRAVVVCEIPSLKCPTMCVVELIIPSTGCSTEIYHISTSTNPHFNYGNVILQNAGLESSLISKTHPKKYVNTVLLY